MMHPSRRLVQVLVLLYGLLLVPSSTLAIPLPVPTGVGKAQANNRLIPIAGISIVDDSVFHSLLPIPTVISPFSVQDDGNDDGSQQPPQPEPTPTTNSPPPPPPPTPTPTPTPSPQPTVTSPSPTSTTNQISVQASDAANQGGDGSLPTASVVTVTISPGQPLPTTSTSIEAVPTDGSNSSVQSPSEVTPPATGLAPAMIALITIVVGLAVVVCAGVIYVKYWRRRRRQSEKEFYDPESGNPSATGSQLSMAQSHLSTLPSATARMTPLSNAGSIHRPSYPLPSDPFSVPTAYNRNDVLIMPPMPSSGSGRSPSPSHSANSSLSSYPTRPSHSASSSLSQQASPPGLTGSSSGTLQAPAAPSPRNPFADGPPSPNPEIRIQPPSLPSSEGSVFSDYDELGSDMFFVPPPANPPSQQPGHAY